MTQTEQVLCIPRRNLPEAWTDRVISLALSADTFFTTCGSAGWIWMQRRLVEQDPSYKQVIPYILLQAPELTAVYRRQGSEKRLHDLWSAGIGGHINPIDTAGKNPSFREILTAGMERELDEELASRPVNDPSDFLGIINEEETAVGSVHLGAVFRIRTQNPDRYLAGEELTEFTWMPTRQVRSLTLERWSELAFELL